MSVVALPDLNALPADALRALILAQHEQLISREREIEHLQLLLAKLHYDVEVVANGREAVEALRAGSYDLVLMDCQMPEMDGYEATRAIRQIEIFQGRTTPIIALTAHAMVDSRDASLDAGMNDQLTKPLTMSALTSMLLAWLTVGAPTVAAEAPGGVAEASDPKNAASPKVKTPPSAATSQ